MDFKKRTKIENIIFYMVFMLGFMIGGAFIGAFIGVTEKRSGSVSLMESILSGILGLIILFLAFMINMYMHEVGHVLFGLMTGYHFSSLRFGKIMLVKSDGKLKIKKYSMPGTGGQALMLPPSNDLYHFPVFWYNAGGLVMNLFLCFLGGLGYAAIPGDMMYFKMFMMSLMLTGAILFVTNALPFLSMGTDGANIVILLKDRNAKFVFHNNLELAKYLCDGIPIKNMPESLFEYDREMKMINPLVTSQAVNRFSYLIIQKKFEEAYELGQYILDNAVVINQLHELNVRIEMIYILVVHKKAYDEARQAYHTDEKRFKKIGSLMSYQRSMYAYYRLAEPDEKKAEACLKTFEAIAKHYPYPEDARVEREMLEYANLLLCRGDGTN